MSESTTSPPFPIVELMGVPFISATENRCAEYILEEVQADRGGWVVTPNLDILRQRRYNNAVDQLMSEATFRVADGMPLVWASWVQGTPLPERVTGSNLIITLSQEATRHGRSIFLLGGDPGMADGAAGVLKGWFKDLKVAGTYCPPMGFDKDDSGIDPIIEILKEAKPDIVFVGLGCPKQEKLIKRLRPHLPNTWWMGVGISFSFLCGKVHRAPKWMQKMGMEWVHRLAQEPKRLSQRYLVHDIPFFFVLIMSALRARFKHDSKPG
ncbi:MAG: WecB/TagA/CpsF family glycosyltransferase [Planctomycetota bacterium]|jgi:N-acetylglucosaminyldiphosphoundecaprenol N-acetyl-beta-D-mannosaminyltransferase